MATLFDSKTLDSLVVKQNPDGKRKPKSSKKEWKFAQISDNASLFHYYNEGEIIKDIPKELEPHLSFPHPIGFGTYKSRNKKGSITVYLLNSSKQTLRTIAKQKEIKPVFIDTKDALDIDSKYHIKAKFVNFKNLDITGIPHWSDLEKKVKNVFRNDVVDFIGNSKLKKEPLENAGFMMIDRYFSRKDYLEKLNPIKITSKTPAKNFVRFGKSSYHESCNLDLGVDLSRGCAFNITEEFTFNLLKRCQYCYARHENNSPFLNSVYKIEKGNFKSRFLELINQGKLNSKQFVGIRLGQDVEMMIPKIFQDLHGFHDSLTPILEDIIELREQGYKLKVAMPTKSPEFDEERARLLREAGISLQISIAYDDFEDGPVDLGFSSQTRLKEGMKYKNAGVFVSSFVATDVTRGPEHFQDEAKLAMKFQKEYGLPMQIIDFRIAKKSQAFKVAGDSWNNLSKHSFQTTLNGYSQGRYHKTTYAMLGANFVHQGILNLIGNNRGNIRGCYTHGNKEFDPNTKDLCGDCFMLEAAKKAR